MPKNKLIIHKLYYSPIKSLSFCSIKKLEINKRIGVVNDRIYAFTKTISKNLSLKYQNMPKSRNLNNFLTLKNTPEINNFNFIINKNFLFLYFKKKLINKVFIKNKNNISNLFKKKFPKLKNVFFISNKKYPFYDTMPNHTISMINMSSINDFENKINKKIEHERFRGNIYIKNLNPWSEFKLINKIILINKCSFLVLSKKAIVSYKVDSFYNKDYDSGIKYDDPKININWKLTNSEIILSNKDSSLQYIG